MKKEEKQKLFDEADKIATDILFKKKIKVKKKMCTNIYPLSENGDVFCHKKEGHKGCHSAIVYWEDNNDY